MTTEAEILNILEMAVMPEGRVLVGAELAAFGRRLGGVDLGIARDASAPEAADFG